MGCLARRLQFNRAFQKRNGLAIFFRFCVQPGKRLMVPFGRGGRGDEEGIGTGDEGTRLAG